MSADSLHPNVQKFKDFVDDQPKVKEQLRKNHKLIQGYYEKWMILGSEDPFWNTLPAVKKTSASQKKDWLKQLSELMEEINWDDVSKHIEELNGALGQFQQLIADVKKDSNSRKKEMEYPYY